MSNTNVTYTAGGTTIKSSGEVRQFSTGAHRDMATGKGAFFLFPYEAMLEIAKVFEVGGVRYTKNNWRLGMPLSEYVNSAFRHTFKAGQGWDDENHPAQAAWNWICFMQTRHMIQAGQLPAELDDISNWLTNEGVAKALAAVKAENQARVAAKAAGKPNDIGTQEQRL
jgi:hypothetical protein